MTYSYGSKLHEFLQAATETPEAKLRRSADGMFDTVHQHWLRNQEQVRGILGPNFSVDEMALYFPDRELLTLFVSKAVQRGWVLFNFAEDEVTTRPIVGAYLVEYWFLRHPDRDYRLELMMIPDGFSPLHLSIQEALKMAGAPVSLVHASFKVMTEEAYGAAGVALRSAGYELAQHCVSHYGRFSYYYADQASGPALKPRLNTRDDMPLGGADSAN